MDFSQDNLAASRNPDWAIFLPAISSFYISSLGKERETPGYFGRTLPNIPDFEQLNFLDKNAGLYYYAHGLYSAGHADLDCTNYNEKENIVRQRDPGIFMLGDSGGFQILKGQWPADWKDPHCPRAHEKRTAVLEWMETYMDYGMCLDIPSESFKNTRAIPMHGIHNIQEAITGTHTNNQYFINNRRGNCKFLNVMQGTNHTESDAWYLEMRKYCDPKIYPDNHFNGWAFGGQNKAEPELMLSRLVHIVHDGLLQQGRHDWIHFLGLSQLEWAVMFSDLQAVLRKHWNPSVTLSFDCASPFMSAAKGLVYTDTSIEHDRKWVYRMEPALQGQQYAGDGRGYSLAALAEGAHTKFTDSPVTSRITVGDVNPRGVGALTKQGRIAGSSLDTLSYVLLQSHNNWCHLKAVERANQAYDSGVIPEMIHPIDEHYHFKAIVARVFDPALSKAQALDLIKDISKHWTRIKGGVAFNTGKRSYGAKTNFTNLFDLS